MRETAAEKAAQRRKPHAAASDVQIMINGRLVNAADGLRREETSDRAAHLFTIFLLLELQLAGSRARCEYFNDPNKTGIQADRHGDLIPALPILGMNTTLAAAFSLAAFSLAQAFTPVDGMPQSDFFFFQARSRALIVAHNRRGMNKSRRLKAAKRKREKGDGSFVPGVERLG